MLRSILAKRAWLLLAAATLITYFYGLGSVPLLGADEPRYAQVAREMFARGDFITPTLAGLHWFEKPPLLYWMMMVSYALFGVTEFAARFGPAMSGLLTIFFAGWVAYQVEEKSDAVEKGYGLISSAVVASSGGLLVFARGASFDIILTASLTATLSCFFLAEIDANARRRKTLLAGFYFGIGLSLLAKGLIGVVFPCAIITVYYLIRREWPNILRLGFWWGVPLALAVAAVWYAPAVARHGNEFINEFIIQHHFARYFSNKYQHPQPFYFYLPITLLLALPWTFFLTASLADLRKSRWRGESANDKMRVFAFAWLIVIIGFFSLSGSKLPGYVLPALPAALLLASQRITRYLQGENGLGLMRLTGAVALIIGIAGCVYLFVSDVSLKSSAAVVLLPSVTVGTICLLQPSRRELCITSLVAGSFLTVFLIVAFALGDIARRDSLSELFAAAHARGMGDVPVFELHTIERSAEFYAAGRLVYAETGQPLKLEGANEVFDAARSRGGRALVIVPNEYFYQLENFPKLRAQRVGDNGAHALVFVEVMNTE